MEYYRVVKSELVGKYQILMLEKPEVARICYHQCEI